jgi:hypothetical protein
MIAPPGFRTTVTIYALCTLAPSNSCGSRASFSTLTLISLDRVPMDAAVADKCKCRRVFSGSRSRKTSVVALRHLTHLTAHAAMDTLAVFNPCHVHSISFHFGSIPFPISFHFDSLPYIRMFHRGIPSACFTRVSS